MIRYSAGAYDIDYKHICLREVQTTFMPEEYKFYMIKASASETY